MERIMGPFGLARGCSPGPGAENPDRSAQNDFNYPERCGLLAYRDTESRFRRDHPTIASPSGRPEERRRLAAYPAVHSASAVMIAVSATNAPLLEASAPNPAAR